MGKKKKQEKELKRIPELTISPELKEKVDTLLDGSINKVEDFWSEDITEIFYVPVNEEEEIRVVHVKPKNPKNKRTMLFVPGWGVILSEFHVLYEVLYEDIEFYYIDTGEKISSRVNRWGKNLTAKIIAQDIQTIVEYLKLTNEDYFIVGSCWSSTIILLGIKENILKAPNYLLFDPMSVLTYNKFILAISPIFPSFLISILKKVMKFFVLNGMKEEHQKQRDGAFIDNAIIWKWKRTAYQNRKLNIFDFIGEIDKEVAIVNGSEDRFHAQEIFVREAKTMLNGRFFYPEVSEDNRERLMSVVMREFALVDGNNSIPASIKQFEKELVREDK